MHHAYSMRFECCEHKSDHSLVTFKRPNCLLRLRTLKPHNLSFEDTFFLTGREPANKQTHWCTHGGYRFATVRRGRWRKLQRRQKEQKKAVSTISTYQIYFKTVIAYYSPNSAIIISLKSPISEGQSLLTRYIHLLVSWICANSGRQSYLSTDVCT